MEQLILETKHMKGKGTGNGQHEFTVTLINLVTYSEKSGLVDEGIAVPVFYLDFGIAFGAFSHEILTDKLSVYEPGKRHKVWLEASN